MFHIPRRFLQLTLRRDLNKLIVVAGHMKVNAEELDGSYMEVYRSESEEFKHRVYFIDGVDSPSITWSEYAQLLYALPLPEDVDTFGFMHYRSMLDLTRTYSNLQTISFSLRKHFSEVQESEVDKYAGKIVVGEKLQFPNSAWQQFVDCHPNSEKMLWLACKKFDTMFDSMDSESVLKSRSYIYSRNMFVAPAWFANSWGKISLDVIKYLDENAQDGCEERWGGFILERLFSVYVDMLSRLDSSSVIERPVVFFEEK